MKFIFKLIGLLCLINSFMIAKGQIISTFAGGGTGGNGIPATATSIYDPNGGIFDKNGNYFFTTGTGGTVRMVDTLGMIHTVAGGGSGGDGVPAIASHLFQIPNVYIDSDYNMYFSDVAQYKVKKVDGASGIITTFAGSGYSGFGGDGGPATADSVRLNGSTEVVMDKKGNLYIGDPYNYRIRKVNTEGIISTYVGNGIWGTSGDGGPATAAELSWPLGLAIDQFGNLFIADNAPNLKIRKVDTNGIITCIAGNGVGTFNGDGIPATTAFIDPVKVGVDTFGNVYICDNANNRVRYVNKNGYIKTLCGNGYASPESGEGIFATSATFGGPGGITFDNCNNAYITEVNYDRIRKVTFPHCNYMDVKEVQNSTNEKFIISPNPTTQYLYLSCNEPIENVYMCNAIGQKVFEAVYNQNQKTEIDIGFLPAGIYYVCVNRRQWGKVVKE